MNFGVSLFAEYSNQLSAPVWFDSALMRLPQLVVMAHSVSEALAKKLPVVVSGAGHRQCYFASVVDMPNGHARMIKAIVDLMMIISV